MNRSDAIQLVALLEAAFPGDMSKERVELYADRLGPLDREEARQAIDVLIDTGVRLPTVGHIKRLVAERRLQLPVPADAWIDVAANRTPAAELPEPVRHALEHVGGRYAIRTSEMTAAVRRQFLDAYDSYREQAIRREIEHELAGATATNRKGDPA